MRLPDEVAGLEAVFVLLGKLLEEANDLPKVARWAQLGFKPR